MYNPTYYVTIISGKKKYEVTNALVSLDLIENDGEIAQRVNCTLANIMVSKKYLSDIFKVRDSMCIYAKTDGNKQEVFRGYIWNILDDISEQKELSFIAYDNLIYFQKSQDYIFEESGSNTKTIATSICKNWGVKLSYTYKSITHGKLALRGYLSDIFIRDLMEEVKRKTGVKGVMRSEKGKVYIKKVGSNTTIYTLEADKIGINVKKETSMPEITKIVILGTEQDNKRAEIKTTLSKNTKTYGTLQRIETSSSDTDYSKVKSEANATLKEKAVAKEKYTFDGIDIPFIRKGDKVQIESENTSLKKNVTVTKKVKKKDKKTGKTKTVTKKETKKEKVYYIVTSISHDAVSKKMSLELEEA